MGGSGYPDSSSTPVPAAMKLHRYLPFVAGAVLWPILNAPTPATDCACSPEVPPVVDQDPPQDPPAGSSPSAAELQAAYARVAQLVTPGPKHELLKRFLGEWDVATSFVMGGERSPAERSRMTASWMIDGRWLEMRIAGKLMGEDHQGCTLLGHDNFKQCYVMTMVSSVDTMMLRAEGRLSREGDVLTVYGQMDEYMTGEHDKMVKYVWRLVSADEFTFEVHDLAIGEPNTMVIESRYTRRKS